MPVNTGNEWLGYLWRVVRTNQTSGRLWKKRKKKKAIRVWLCRYFCWHGTSQPKWRVAAHNKVLIYYLILPPPSDEVIMQYKLQLGPETLSADTADHSLQEKTARSHEDSAAELEVEVDATGAGSQRERDRSRGFKEIKWKRNPKYFSCILLDSKLTIL